MRSEEMSDDLPSSTGAIPSFTLSLVLLSHQYPYPLGRGINTKETQGAAHQRHADAPQTP